MTESAFPLFENIPEAFKNELLDTLKTFVFVELQKSAEELQVLKRVSQNERLVIELILPSFGLKSEKLLAFALKKVIINHAIDPTKVDLNFYSEVKPLAVQSVLKENIADIRNIILVSSGKGGVGKSTIASNLAVAMASLGCRVGLLDADVYGPSMPIMFGLTAEGQVKGVEDKESNVTYMIPPHKHDVSLMSLGFLVDTESPMIWRGPMIASASMQMFHNVMWGQLDYLIVDLPPGTGDIQLTIAQKINVAGAVVVSTPQDVALSDVVRAKKMFDKVGIPILGLVENMSYFMCNNCDTRHEIFSNGGAQEKAKALGIDVLAEIPLISEVRKASDDGAPIAISKENPQTAALFTDLAHGVITQVVSRLLKGEVVNSTAQNNPKPAAPEEPMKKRRLSVL